MRILMIGPGEGVVGGIRTLVETLLPKLSRQTDLHYLPTVSRRALKESGKLTFKNLLFSLSQYFRFIRDVFRFHPDIIHLHTSQGLGWIKDTIYVLVGKLLRIAVVIHVNAASYEVLYGGQSRLYRWYTKKVMAVADIIIAPSSEWEHLLAEIVPKDHIVTFRNCIDTHEYYLRGVAPASQGSIKILFLGSVGPRKGAFDLIEAINQLKPDLHNIQVWIAGYEERAGDLDKAAARLKELGLECYCQLPGAVIGEKKKALLQNADIFTLPTYSEGLPLAIGEALAAGLPVISTPVGGIGEVIEDGFNGFLIQPGDVTGLSDRISMLARDPALREVMGQRSRRVAEQKLDVEDYVRRLVDLYCGLLQA